MKIKIKDIAMTVAGATAGAYAANLIDDQVTDMITDDKQELGAKIVLAVVGGIAATNTKGVMRDAIVAATGSFGNGAIETARAMTGSKPVKGMDEELEGIYEEIDAAMQGATDAEISGDNSPIISGANTEFNPEED